MSTNWSQRIVLLMFMGLALTLGTQCGPAFAGEKSGQKELAEALKHISPQGTPLPYTVLRSDLLDVKKPGTNFEIRNGGFGSAMTAHPTKANQFYALTDRGPNASFKGAQGKGKLFPTPDYTPRIGLFELRPDGSVRLVKTILLRRPDGTRITGLPNSSGLGGTGETPYHADGSPILKNGAKPFNNDAGSADYNPLRLDDYGLDGEGLAALSDGTFWVSDEYGPHIVHFDADGKEIGRINAFADDKRSSIKLPKEFANRRANRGMEGLTITPDEKTLVGVMQSTMYNPTKKVKKLNVTRIVAVNLETGHIAQYLYKQEKAQNSNSEIAALSNNQFILIERDGAFARKKPEAMKRVYKIDLRTGTNLENASAAGTTQDDKLGLLLNGKTMEQTILEDGWEALDAAGIKPVKKTLVVDMVRAVHYPHDKMEGLWVINDHTLGVLNDDDFAIWSTKGKLHQKYLDAHTIDCNTLYIVNADLTHD